MHGTKGIVEEFTVEVAASIIFWLKTTLKYFIDASLRLIPYIPIANIKSEPSLKLKSMR